jgi:hypothetical protein
MNIQVSSVNQLAAVTFASHETNHTQYKLVGYHRAYELPAEGTCMERRIQSVTTVWDLLYCFQLSGGLFHLRQQNLPRGLFHLRQSNLSPLILIFFGPNLDIDIVPAKAKEPRNKILGPPERWDVM